MKQDQRLIELLNSYTAGTCTPAREQELMQMIASGEYDAVIKQYMMQAWRQLPVDHMLGEEQAQRIRNVVLKTQAPPVIPSYRNRRWLKMAAAAIILLLAGGGAVYLFNNRSASSKQLAVTKQPVIKPGTDGAVLTLADGSTIILDSASDGNLASQANVQVVKTGGHIQYLPVGTNSDNASLYNTIGTAKGKQFQLLLEDGTRVWLNAASSIRFPVSFSKTNREVEVSGEAYFDVAQDSKRPFRVKAGSATVDVLGTQFNINSYRDEAAVTTTLVEGAVKLKNGNNEHLMYAGQLVEAFANGNTRVFHHVNTGEIIAWKNNFFSFKDTDIKTLMRQLERWYNVETVYKGRIRESVTFNGDISRGVDLGTVLKMLEMTGEVHFEIQEKTIVVTM
ncbi:FecR family protein [Filimonas effusa]|uniref:DUF4974 domain-containing protein n=1 Tax=Filimonas effusa TaxID=2508721 RepID=A0A4V1M9X0_9BACT|nr:FecR domain-containing protein [Filimonas effusa]RXK83144.1 DUF4974 domain-containing protein [Filimonas effusa]